MVSLGHSKLTHCGLCILLFVEDIFKYIFFENIQFQLMFFLKFFPFGPIDKKSAPVQLVAQRQTGDESLLELMMVELYDVVWPHLVLTRGPFY